MLNKIQQYLLLNYPLLWNIKIVPMLLATVAINILFFLFGYIFTTIDFTDPHSYNDFIESGFMWMGSILSGILLFIVWLVHYSKNNAFKSFYPKSSRSLYLEWLLSFVIIFSLVTFPISFYQGSVSKKKSYVSKQEMIKAVETLNLVKILIPSNIRDYFQEYPSDEFSEGIRTSKMPLDEFGNESENGIVDTVHYEAYPNFTQVSLLNYYRVNEFYVSRNVDFEIRDNTVVKQWLVEQNKEAISQLMDDFLALQAKHNLQSNITKEQWMQLVYNPSKYPVGKFNLIFSTKKDVQFREYPDPLDSNAGQYHYLSYRELNRAYEKVMDAYTDNQDSLMFYTLAISLALGLSLFVFSFRSTSGKSWLIALVSLGLILFVNGIISFSFESGAFYLILLLILFGTELFFVLTKNKNLHPKGRSDIYINHLVWFVPVVPVLLYMLLYLFAKEVYTEQGDSYHKLYRFMDDYIIGFVWANICLTFVSMWIFITCILRKWKSLPEQ